MENKFTDEYIQEMVGQLDKKDLLRTQVESDRNIYYMTDNCRELLLKNLRKKYDLIMNAFWERDEDALLEYLRYATCMILFDNFPSKNNQELQYITDLSTILMGIYWELGFLSKCCMFRLLESDNPSVTMMVDGVIHWENVPKTSAFKIVAGLVQRSTSYIRDNYTK